MWCSSRGADPFKCPLNFVLDFLSELYEKGLQQRTIGVHRSAISAYHCTVDGTPVGKHPRVSALLAGISNLRPPLPKYGFTWDVEIVLQFFLSWPKNSDLTPKELSLKLVTLLGLVATSRSSELQLLDLKFLSKFATYYSFGINGVFKTSKKGRAPKPMDFYSHPEETKLCPFSVIDSYISMTEPWRGKNPRETKLFLSYVPPHKPIVKSTLAGWIKQTLGLTGGIDTSIPFRLIPLEVQLHPRP